MISVVYFENTDGRKVMVGAFLMREDAENFIQHGPFTGNYKVADVDGQWGSWMNIRDALKEIKV